MYDPNIGRFLQKDPEPGKIGTPITLVNSYIYAGNNPFSFSDPTGRSFTLGSVLSGIGHGIQNAFGGGTIGAILGTLVFPPAILFAKTGDFLMARPALDQAATVAAVIAVAGFTGGAAGGLAAKLLTSSALAGAFVGGAVGAAVGGLVGGIGYKLTGVGTFWQGFIAGAIAGGTAGAIAGYNAGAANAAAEAGQNLANVRMKPFHSLEFDDYNVCGFVFTIIGSYSQFVSGFGDAAIEYASIIAPQCFEGAPGVPTI
jgi:hypothetical protein